MDRDKKIDWCVVWALIKLCLLVTAVALTGHSKIISEQTLYLIIIIWFISELFWIYIMISLDMKESKKCSK
jgi:hypothetical protein